MRILVFNAGSSSLKFELHDMQAGSPVALATGAFADFSAGVCSFAWRAGERRGERHVAADNLAEAATLLLDWLYDRASRGTDLMNGLAATAHRVVHGGERFRVTTRLDGAALAALSELSPLAPLHNPPALAVIETVRARLGTELPLVAAFDTAYYASLPPAAQKYAVPDEWCARYGIRRYGFHGIAHRYLCHRTQQRLSCSPEQMRVISLQLGRGCSVTASRGLKPVATSMGFTPLEGLVMGTRSGDIDAGAVLHVMERTGMSAAEMSRLLNEQSGLLGLSGCSADMRELLALEARGHPGATVAIEAFCRRARHYVGAFLAELGGADSIVFGGGIGENCPSIRRRILKEMGWAAIKLDTAANAEALGVESDIQAPTSAVALHVVPVRESAAIAAEAAACLHELKQSS